jgi:Arc/MetJ family transcription regulator
MRQKLASRIMRTTIDIDDPILKEVKRLQLREGKSLGRLVSDLLAQSLAAAKATAKAEAPAFQWVAKPMRARLDLADKNALLDAMDERGA